jgi:iron complex transport system permease protein
MLKSIKTTPIQLNSFLLIAIGICVFWDLDLNSEDINNSFLFWELRFPRVMGSIVVGMALALSGLMMQTLFRNPLAGPYLIGVTPGAGLAVAIVTLASPLIFGQILTSGISTIAAAFLGALGALFLQFIINRGYEGTHRLLLTGMILSFVFSAITELLQQFANSEQLRSFAFWGMGSFERIQNSHNYILLPVVLIAAIVIWLKRFALDAYLLGDLYAESAGVNTKQTKRILILFTAILSALSTAFAGPIAFVGIIAPHLAKRTLNTDSHPKIIVNSLLWGMLICVFSDALAHRLIQDTVLQVNPIISILGAPILLVSFLRK